MGSGGLGPRPSKGASGLTSLPSLTTRPFPPMTCQARGPVQVRKRCPLRSLPAASGAPE